MDCEELLKALNDYVDEDIDPGVCKDFEQHLAGCNPCQVVIDNIRKTISLYKDSKPYAMPPEFHSRLNGILKEHWRKKFSS